MGEGLKCVDCRVPPLAVLLALLCAWETGADLLAGELDRHPHVHYNDTDGAVMHMDHDLLHDAVTRGEPWLIKFFLPKGSHDCNRLKEPYKYIANKITQPGHRADFKMGAVDCVEQKAFCRWHGIKNTWQLPMMKVFNFPHTPDSGADAGVEVESMRGDPYHVSLQLQDPGHGLYHLYGDEQPPGADFKVLWRLTKVLHHEEHNEIHDTHEMQHHFRSWLTDMHPGEEVINHRFKPVPNSHLRPYHEYLMMSHKVIVGCPMLVVKGEVKLAEGSKEWQDMRLGEYQVQRYTSDDRPVYCKVGQAKPKSCIYYIADHQYNRHFWSFGPSPGLDQAWAVADDNNAKPENIQAKWSVYDMKQRHWAPSTLEVMCKGDDKTVHHDL